MPEVPSAAEVIQHLTEVVTNGFSSSARRKANAWATPILITHPMLDQLSPLYGGLFLLGVADTPAGLQDPLSYVYGQADFEYAIRRLTDESRPTG
jgi:hypothetical protein